MASGFGVMLRRLFGVGGGAAQAEPGGEPVDYNGYNIRPDSFRDGVHWITAAVISKPDGDEVREHRLVRADMFPAREAADAFAVTRAKRMIDEMGDGLFGMD